MTTVDRKETDYATAHRVKVNAEDSARAQALPGFVQHAKAIGADFTLDIYTAAQLTAVLDAIGGHNDYNPRRAAALLGPLVDEAMQVRVEHFVSGPAIYFQIPYTEQQRIASRRKSRPSVRLSDDERNDLAQRILDAGQASNADERGCRQQDGDASVVWNKPGPRPYEIRLWWD